MERIFCPSCGLEQPREHSYCVRCGLSLPSHLLTTPPAKRARFFAGIKVADADPEGGFLRVTCYGKDHTFESREGPVPMRGRHVRFSVWVGEEARCVLSVNESEALELAAFIHAELGRPDGVDLTTSIAG